MLTIHPLLPWDCRSDDKLKLSSSLWWSKIDSDVVLHFHWYVKNEFHIRKPLEHSDDVISCAKFSKEIFGTNLFSMWILGLCQMPGCGQNPTNTAWKVSKYAVFSGSYFPAFDWYGDLRSKSRYSVRIQENTDQKKLRTWTLFTQLKHSPPIFRPLYTTKVLIV